MRLYVLITSLEALTLAYLGSQAVLFFAWCAIFGLVWREDRWARATLLALHWTHLTTHLAPHLAPHQPRRSLPKLTYELGVLGQDAFLAGTRWSSSSLWVAWPAFSSKKSDARYRWAGLSRWVLFGGPFSALRNRRGVSDGNCYQLHKHHANNSGHFPGFSCWRHAGAGLPAGECKEIFH